MCMRLYILTYHSFALAYNASIQSYSKHSCIHALIHARILTCGHTCLQAYSILEQHVMCVTVCMHCMQLCMHGCSLVCSYLRSQACRARGKGRAGPSVAGACRRAGRAGRQAGDVCNVCFARGCDLCHVCNMFVFCIVCECGICVCVAVKSKYELQAWPGQL